MSTPLVGTLTSLPVVAAALVVVRRRVRAKDRPFEAARERVAQANALNRQRAALNADTRERVLRMQAVRDRQTGAQAPAEELDDRCPPRGRDPELTPHDDRPADLHGGRGGSVVRWRGDLVAASVKYGRPMPLVLVTLYAAAAVLPILGFGRLLYRTQKRIQDLDRKVEERGYSHVSYDDVDNLLSGDVREPLWGERRALVWDILFVGTGLVAGAIASIWSVFAAL